MVDYAKLAGALGASGGGGGGGDLAELLRAIRARQGGGGQGNTSLQSFLDRMRQRDANVQITPPKEAPGTWNLGESLLNLIAIGSSPAASQGQAAGEELKRLGRIQGNMATGEDQAWMRDFTRRAREQGTPLAVAGEIGNTAGRLAEGTFGGVGDTLNAIFGGGDSSKIPTWAKNLESFETAAANMEGRQPDPNDVGNAIGGIGLDIALDPTTYLTLGLGGALKGAFRGAKAAGGEVLSSTGEGTGVFRAAVRPSQAEKLGVPAGTALDRAVTRTDRLQGALEGAGAGFREEAGQFWPAQLAEAAKARKAAKAAGTVDATVGLAPANAATSAARAVEDAQRSASVVDDLLTPAAKAAADTGEELLQRSGDDIAEAARQAANLSKAAPVESVRAAEAAPRRIDEGSNLALRPNTPTEGVEFLPDRSFDELAQRWPKMSTGVRQTALRAIGREDLDAATLAPEEYAAAYREFASTANVVGELTPEGKLAPFPVGDPRTAERVGRGGTEFTQALDRLARGEGIDPAAINAAAFGKGGGDSEAVMRGLLNAVLGREATPQELGDFMQMGRWVGGRGVSASRQVGGGDPAAFEAMMETASRLIDDAPIISKTLYRGVAGANTDEFGLNLFTAQVDDVFTLPPSSWSDSRRAAEKFGGGDSVLLKLVGEKPALSLNSISDMGEYLTKGEYRITAVGEANGFRVLTVEALASPAARATSETVDALADDLLGSVSGAAARSTRDQLVDAWGTTLAKSVNTYARGTQEALRSIKLFEPKPVATPLSSVGTAGEKDVLGGVVSFWKQVKSGQALSKPRAALKPQLDELAKTRIPRARLAETHPNLAAVLDEVAPAGKRAASGTLRTTVDAGRVLDLLASDRLGKAVRALERGGKVTAPRGDGIAQRIAQLAAARGEGNLELLRSADAEARDLIGKLVDRVSAKAMKGASTMPVQAQREAWQMKAIELLSRTARGAQADDAWAAKTATQLSRITDPVELGARLDAIASTVHQVAHRGPKDFFDYITRLPAREVLAQVDAEAIRDLSRTLGLPTKGNTVTVLKGLRENGYRSYQEAMASERAAAKAFGSEYDVAGGQLIDDGVRALGNDVTAVKATQMRDAEAKVAAVDPEDVEGAVLAPLNSALRRNLAGEKKRRWFTKGGELATKGNILDENGNLVEVTLVERFDQHAGYQAFAGAARHFAAKADKLGLTGAARGQYMDEQMMKALAAQDAYLRARGMPPTSRMDNAEKSFRLGGKDGLKHRNEVAFLSLRDVLEEIPQQQRILLLFGGARASVPPTILHMLGRWAIRRFEAPTAEIAEQVAAHRNAYIQHAWKTMGGRTAFADSNRFGALADQILSDPAIVARLSEKHVRNAINARAVWADTAASATMGVRDAFRKVITSPHATSGAKIEALLGLSSKIAKAVGQAGIEDDLVQSMAHLDASVLAGELVGPELWYAARRSAEVREVERVSESGKAMTDADVIALRERYGEAEVAANIEAVRRGDAGAFRRLPETLRTDAARRAEATASTKFLRDAEQEVRDVTDGLLRAMRANGQEVGMLDAMAVRTDVQIQLGFQNRMLQGGLTRMKRAYGAEEADALRVRAQFSPVQMIARFSRGLATVAQKYGSTTAPALVNGFKLLQRLSTDPEGFKVMAEYMDAVKGAIAGQAPREGVQEAREALLATLTRVGAENAGDESLEAAVDLWPAVATVFDPGPHGLFARAGNDANSLNGILKTFQRVDADGKPLEMYGGFHFTKNGAAGDLGPAWRMIGAGGQQIDPIEILRSTHAALQHATIAPTAAASFSAEFGHAAAGLTREEALKAGWKAPYKQSEARRPFVKYLDPTQLYDPEHLSKLKYLDDLLQGVQKPGPFLTKLFELTDPIVQALKSSITIWRPGHWMTNIQGEAWMNTFAGVTNPMRYADAMALMARQHRMVKPDFTPFDDYLARNTAEGRAPRPIDPDTPYVEVPIGGKMQRVPDDLIYRGMEQRGIVLSHLQADDVAFDVEKQAVSVGQKKPFQTVRNVNRALGRGSVARDSVFRVAHALDVMKKGSFRSLDEALDAAATQVHKWHPSYQTLTPFDQVYTRRVLYFYTWMRQAIARMVEMSLNTPSLAALPSRVMYALSYASGLDPQSVGAPVSQDLDLPDYLAHSMTGSAIKVNDRVYGMSLNAPTTDIFSQLIGPANIDPTLSVPDNVSNAFGALVDRNFGQMISPALTVPFSVATDQTVRGQAYTPEEGFAGRLQNLIDQTGAAYPSKITGQLLPGVARTDQRVEPEDQAEKQWLALINALTGMKFTAQSAQNVQNSAERDERDRFARWLEAQRPPAQ